MLSQSLNPEFVNAIFKLLGCSTLLVLALRRNRMNRVVALGAVTVFVFFAFSLMDHYDVINRPPWSDKFVFLMAISLLILAAMDILKWVEGKRRGSSSSIKREIEVGLDGK
jgi:NADH:ubiquinone oxidoreductase subunit 6 (subunit J)